jgi:ABC-type uncharacterized transport system permease subunit
MSGWFWIGAFYLCYAALAQTIITQMAAGSVLQPRTMPILWLRVALGFYSVGLLCALAALLRRDERLNRAALPAMVLGMVFQFVSLTEAVLISGKLTLTSTENSQSFLALLVMAAVLFLYLVYHTTAPGIVVFPLVFLLTLLAAIGQQPFLRLPASAHRGWVFVHVTLLLIGYAALIVSFCASLLYLVQERSLKSKNLGGILSRLPALEVTDEIGFRSLLLGFPFMTVGLIIGTVLARSAYDKIDFLDPKIFLSYLMWAVYLVLVYTRWNAGFRGRRAAYFAMAAFVVAVVAWSANYYGALNRFIRS